MPNESLRRELEDYSSKELEYIFDTQKNLFSEEEMNCIAGLIEERRGEERARVAQFLPEEIECPKCGAPNEFERDVCKYCGFGFNKKPYYEMAEFLAEGGDPDDLSTDEDQKGESYLFQYVISFIIPLVGYIVGSIMLTKEDEEQRSVGKTCIIIAIVSSLAFLAVTFAFLA